MMKNLNLFIEFKYFVSNSLIDYFDNVLLALFGHFSTVATILKYIKV